MSQSTPPGEPGQPAPPGQPGQPGQVGQPAWQMPPGQPAWQGPPGPQAPAAPARKSRVGLVIGLVAAAVVLLCVCGGVVAMVSGDDTSPTGADTTTEAAKDDAPAENDAEQPKEAAGKIGQPVRDGKFEFTVTKVERGKTKVGNEYLNKKAQGEFVFVRVTVKNIGDEPQAFFGENQKLISADGKEYSADNEAAIYIEDSASLYEEINPGNQVKGIVVFDVPKGTKLATLELHDSSLSGGVEVSF